ncbi:MULTISPECIES: bifunctional metallophosphatase/5'-nucleotidase [unclassified Tolypothrix]|uniref:bifunctional metallophosphatase/5'-nucleotidase n=1 Tax=unclassified Tolypothrix TaxID=2649714 RepID=UPI0005EAA99E|nr:MULTISPECIES: bifunctional metallophosphatase/5'-nucleotidase [unclassified Tolypothrix]EKF06106.1 5'-nucleotidase protein [Tolypothrix sp. PCC 7601]MBE9080735.1 bifunctional metallophosphatase/5'-nucleotidase [Tolypothrix sp. LEGE 11397]UYD29602.1 bifunctional metallophosphatase/5'-nucleotidase [Tolypothrix sp. PCC 7712]UYD34482.1 bifunctional metallophosphatase/5'-nucleotidase [Tolypothrix sp. PCC 7601]
MRLIPKGCSIVFQLLAMVALATPALAEIVNINLLQLNDIYEITPVEGGTRGGLARVATLRQQLYNANPRTYTVLAGDAFSPSALGTAKINGVPLAGQQMVAVMNAVGFDYATFGNHEFDLPEQLFYQRLQESRFRWVSSNVSDSKGQPFKSVPRAIVLNVKGDRGAVVRVGLIGLTLNSNPAKYVSYTDPIATAKQQVKELKGKADIIVAITHLPYSSDIQLAEAVPEIDIILGGHEHENIQAWRGRDLTPIFKADANARTVYVHQLTYDTVKKSLAVNSRLVPITEKIPDEPKTAKVVREWLEKGYQAFRANGFNPDEQIAKLSFALDGLESSIRNKSTQLTDLIAAAMLKELPDADLAVFNGGSIRIDDVIPPGPITQYDVIRILPFGGKVVAIEINGALLKKVLDQGQLNKGTGGYLQIAKVTQEANSGNWLINNQPLDVKRTYKVATTEFLISGKEIGLDFLNLQQPGIKLIAQKRDIRFAVIDQMKSHVYAK